MRNANWIADAMRRSKGRVLSLFCAMALVVSVSIPGRADVRNAVKHALPATVGVEWHDAEAQEKPEDQSAVRHYTGRKNQLRMASGTIVSPEGLIVTTLEGRENGHFSVTLGDGKALDAKLLVDDRRSGLRLLKVEAAGLPDVSLSGDSAQIGEEVTATYCLDLKQRAAVRGIVAATGRQLDGMGSDLLQLDFDAGMMSGGSPLVNEQGKLVGIIAYRRKGEGHSSTFAIPAASVRLLLETPRKESTTVLQRGLLGIYLDPNRVADDGKVRARLVTGSPAAAAGMHDGDEILTIDGEKVESLNKLSGILSTRLAGQQVHLGIQRDGRVQGIDVTLAPAPGERSTHTETLAPPAIDATGREMPAPPIRTVRPDSIYVIDDRGLVRALDGKESEKTLESVRSYYEKTYRAQLDAASQKLGDTTISTPTIQLERSHVEKKLEAISRDVQSLREQMEKLTQELQRLQKQLASEQKPQQ